MFLIVYITFEEVKEHNLVDHISLKQLCRFSTKLNEARMGYCIEDISAKFPVSCKNMLYSDVTIIEEYQ